MLPVFSFTPTPEETEWFQAWWHARFGEKLSTETARDRFAHLARFYYHATGYGQQHPGPQPETPTPTDPRPR